MSGTFILPENADVEKSKNLLKSICEFVEKTTSDETTELNKVSDNIGDITKIDAQHIKEHADDFGMELRDIGTVGLSQKYVGRYCIHIYGEVPGWFIGLTEDLLKSRYLHCTCRNKERW
jgi:hypothetical protein